MIFINIIILLMGFIILIKAADYFIEGASSLSINLKISPLIIGLLIVGFGTSLPELAVSVNAHLIKEHDVLLGNVIGSNVLNILLILGVTICIFPIKVEKIYLKKEMPFLIFLTIVLATLFLDTFVLNSSLNILTRQDGLILFLIFFLYMTYTILKQKKTDEKTEARFSLIKSIILVIISLVGIVLGSNLVVENAVSIAYALGISGKIVGLTIVAFGTSLPELVTSITAAKKGQTDLLMGNIIGSNIFNIAIILGLPISIFGSVTAVDFNYIDIIICLLAPILLYILSYKGNNLRRKDGFILLSVFVIYYLYMFIRI